MEGVEIVIKPKHIERIAYSLVILVLLVLLIIKWNGGGCETDTNKTTGAVVTQQQNTTNQTINATQTEDLCANKLKDQDETDADCGGITCEGCEEYEACNKDNDCASGLYCYQHIKCMKASCDDGVKNQDETNIDCGGKCSGYWWSSDSKCHTTKEPSGKIGINLSANVSASPNSGYAIVNSLTINLENGLLTPAFLKVTIYALTASGKPVFSDQEGNNIAIATAELDSIPSGEKLTKIVSFADSTRKTLVGVKSTDAYQLVVEFRNQENVLIEKKSWVNH